MKAIAMVVGLLACGLGVGSARAATVYSNDFETNTLGFSRTNRAPQYIDGTRATQSNFLGPFVVESVTLSLSGLTPGREYSLIFDLFIGGRWTGNNPTSGLDQWRLTVGGISRIDTTFSNLPTNETAVGISQPRTQNYSDATPNGPLAKEAFTGADHFFNQPGNLTTDFSIYYFGHGAGNPVIDFIAASSQMVIVFSGAGRLTAGQEFWALDNVRVETEDLPVEVVPTPGAAGAGMALLAMLGWRRSRRRGS